ncbi:unnamed protein product, partial [Prorocentrum cordatum]
MAAAMWYQSRPAKPASGPSGATSEADRAAEELGLDPERLRHAREWAGKLRGAGKLPGVVLAVARRGRVVFHEAYGDGCAKDGIVSVAAMPVLAATFLSLVDEGLASVHDDVARYIPAFSDFRVHRSGSSAETLQTDALARPITMFHLLTQTWGFPGTLPSRSSRPELRFLDGLAAAAPARPGRDADFARLARVPLMLGARRAVPGRARRRGGRPRDRQDHGQAADGGRPGARDGAAGHGRHRLGGPARGAAPGRRGLAGRALAHAPPLGHPPHRGACRPHLLAGLGGEARRAGRGRGPRRCPGRGSPAQHRARPAQPPRHAAARRRVRGGGAGVLSCSSAALMCSDQLPALGRSLADAGFNTHAGDAGNSPGARLPQLGAGASGQGEDKYRYRCPSPVAAGAGFAGQSWSQCAPAAVLGAAVSVVVAAPPPRGLALGMQVVSRPAASRMAGGRGAFSSWSARGSHCWADPALDLCVFVGAELSPAWALPDLQQEVAGLVYGALVPTAAAKHLVSGEAEAGGWAGQLANAVLMMSMLGGGGLAAGMPGGAAAPGGGGPADAAAAGREATAARGLGLCAAAGASGVHGGAVPCARRWSSSDRRTCRTPRRPGRWCAGCWRLRAGRPRSKTSAAP